MSSLLPVELFVRFTQNKMGHKSNNAKIVCTVGPATSSGKSLSGIIRAGADILRINGAHGTIKEHKKRIMQIRDSSGKLRKQVGILLDLPGPKLRIGDLPKESAGLKKGQQIEFVNAKSVDTAEKIPIPSSRAFKALKPGHDIYINDGIIKVRVKEKRKDFIKGKVLAGGEIRSGKGLNLPDTELSIPALTGRDKELLRAHQNSGLDYVGLSFVRKASAIRALQKRMSRLGMKAGIIAKIETGSALKELEKIVEVSDAVMIARGDLGIEIPYAKVPLAQRKIVAECRKAGKPVITATQMMLSMVSSSRPTRAEANDVAATVWNGSDALMLSEETSIGKFPRESVKAMCEIIRQAEKGEESYFSKSFNDDTRSEDPARIISRAAVDIARKLEASAIVVPTRTGRSAKLMSASRPHVPILVLTSDKCVARKMKLCWGAFPMVIERTRSLDKLLSKAQEAAKNSRLLKKGDRIIVASGAHGRSKELFRFLEVRVV